MTGSVAPTRLIDSPDGVPIAVFSSGAGPAVLLVHGASADHTTFRVIGPLLEGRFAVHAVDRRGRGASGDREPYDVEREFEDVAAVATAIAEETGRPAAVIGHSYGGRCALGAALRTAAIGAVVSYEGAPTPAHASYRPAGVEARLRAHLAAGDPSVVLETFMTEVVGMSAAELERYKADPVWPLRVAAAPTILRELDAESAPAASLAALGNVRQPVLQVLGGDSLRAFGAATQALNDRLRDGSVVVIEGARHAAHHTHPTDFVAAVEAFLA